MITLRDYAEQKGITYEAVRRQVQRYNAELKGHISIKNRTQYLDDWAVSFLSERRRQSPIVIVNEDRKEEVEQLKQQVEDLKNKLKDLTEENMSFRDKLIEVQQENIDLQKKTLMIEIIEAQKNKAQEELETVKTDLIRATVQHESDQKKMDELQQDREDLKQEREDLRKERDDLQKKHEDLQRERDDLKQEQEDLRKERDDLKIEANSFQRSLFGFYRKIK